MKYDKKFFAIILAAAAILILAFLGYIYGTFNFLTPRNSLNDFGFNMSELGNFTIEERFKPYYSDYEEERISAAGKNGEVLKLKVISNMAKDLAEKYAFEYFLIFNSMFDTKMPPYPEFLTNQTGCAKEFLPSKKKTAYGDYYTLYADKRFTFGVCAYDLAKYKAGAGIFYCEKSRKLFNLEYYIDAGESFDIIEKQMDSFVCAK